MGLYFFMGKQTIHQWNQQLSKNFLVSLLGNLYLRFISFVDNNNEKAGLDATEYIINKGAKSIAFIGGRDQLFVSRERLEGYIKALKEYELTVNEKLIAQVDEFTIERGYETIKELLEVGTIDGLVTADSLFAEGAARYLNEKHIQMPIITFDSVRPSVQIDAYVDVHTLELGRSAFKNLA